MRRPSRTAARCAFDSSGKPYAQPGAVQRGQLRVQPERRGAGGDDDGVSAEGRDLFDLGVQADLHAELFHLPAVPRQKVAELTLIALG